VASPSVVVLGSANADLTVRIPRLPEVGETLTGTAFAEGLGGKGLNQAVAAARLGARTAMVGRVGADAYGERLRSGLAADGVDVTDVTVDPSAPSGVAVVLVDEAGQNRVVVVPGTNGGVGEPELERLAVRLLAAEVLLLQLEVPLRAVADAVGIAARLGVRVLLDPAPAPSRGLPPSVYARHVVLTPNEVEAAALVGHPLQDDEAVEDAARTLLHRGAGGVVLTLGARGVCWAEVRGAGVVLGRHPAHPVDVVDTTGAGDATNGALAAALAGGLGLAEAARWGAVAGSLAVAREGAREAMPRRADLLAAVRGPGGARRG